MLQFWVGDPTPAGSIRCGRMLKSSEWGDKRQTLILSD
jgi:hypothetical protein